MRGLLVLALAAATVAVAIALAGGIISGSHCPHSFIYFKGLCIEDPEDLDIWLNEDNLVTFCDNITHNTSNNIIGGQRLHENLKDIMFKWRTEAELAASAVLALAWRCAGIPSVKVTPRTSYRFDDLWYVYLSTPYEVHHNLQDDMEVVGPGVVPVSPQLHVRLAPDAREEVRCTDAFYNKPSFYLGQDMLWSRAFLTRFKNTTTYIIKEWSTIADRDDILYKEFKIILEFLIKHNMSQEYIPRVKLEKLILDERNESFLFVDAGLWRGVKGVWEFTDIDPSSAGVKIPFRLVASSIRSEAPSLWDVTRIFSLDISNIKELLALDMSDPLQAASTWALQRPDNRARLLEWIELSIKPPSRNIDVMLCVEDFSATDYVYLLEAISDKIVNLTIDLNYISINLEKYYINCSSETSWNEKLKSEGKSNYYSIIGTVMSGENVYKVAGAAKYFNHPLLAYSTSGSRPVFALGGTPETFVQSLQQLFQNCSVRRIAVISEKFDIVSDNVTAALNQLHVKGILMFHDVQLSYASDETIINTLYSLVNVNARIFLVNGGTMLAKNIIRVAKKVQLTPEKGFLWIVREWEGLGDETMKPYETTFSYRGGDSLASAELSDLERRLNDRWRNGTWPRYAASVANAVLTLGLAFTRLTIKDPKTIKDVHVPATYRKIVQYSDWFPSMVGDLRIEQQAVKNPRLFVYQWAGEYPTLVAAGGAGLAAVGCPLSVPHDGSIACLTSSDGDAFPPKCNDILWLTCSLVSITVVLIFIMTAIACRRASRAREKRLIEEEEQMGRARLDAFTSSLAPYFVERKALKLQHKIGAGRFGLVWFGMLEEPTDSTRPVAAKALREGAVAEEQSEFFREARNLAVLQHDHVIRFVGVCVADGPPLLLMEHAFFGDLLKYLSNRRYLVESMDTDSTEAQHVSAEALTRFVRDAATALAFIVRRGFVHRDVRAVNCLVDERRVLKLADFGMAREMSCAGNEQDGEYWCRRRTLFPVLWMAPESLSRGVFSTASDIWSLGVLALEVLTLGARPYGGRSPLTVVELVVAGGRPPLPRDVSAAARELLLQCWRRAPAERPTAHALATWLEENPFALRPALADTRTVL